ncbi:type VI secretion system tube protein Hcp [Xenorhabdus bovienii]|uniref:type VI secretion system tube protein Hcp n=1 Tax=Xenorhabdus bovienii TaxID=40576 RepID=UPI00237CD8C2|nr:type VI secretion system tube protein Hcp [Xenorhabdus bovienii]MDE1488509.1 type VI secretion system tube protein Hcp [Xenorhabdus bovienii]MDE9463432.1 type VI secretion system tube protein Hcp [Xenorhabdus bovienii]MDE9471206.1 type VI secretion system tube protein Hcp [Xenorhabdus bovienii]MDE9479377.1 type VI secretion system tube protein Hcp [Xenorhabdus bovienii]MDE9532198.1 type VI secretion system tube protein Hcp [Xenorhabdus bovienii]
MQYSTYMEITGTAQGLLSKNCSDNDTHKDKIQLNYLELSKGVDDLSHIEKVILEKNLDSSSPLLFNAIDKNESLALKIVQCVDNKITHEFKFKNAFIERIETNISENNLPSEKIQLKLA